MKKVFEVLVKIRENSFRSISKPLLNLRALFPTVAVLSGRSPRGVFQTDSEITFPECCSAQCVWVDLESSWQLSAEQHTATRST